MILRLIGKATRLESADGVPIVFELADNYPNPFNPTTAINYSIPDAGRVILDIFNVIGQRVRTLIDKEMLAGRHEVIWNGQDDYQNQLGSGIYFYRLRTEGNMMIVKRMLLIK